MSSSSLTPIARSDKLDLGLTIEAIVLARATRTDALNTQPAYGRLASATFEEYRPIQQRNLFAIGGASADPVEHTYLTSITSVNGRPQAWFTLRTENTVLKLHDGDQLVQSGDTILKLRSVANLEPLSFDDLQVEVGSIAEIQQGSVLVRWDNRLWRPTINDAGSALEFLAFTEPLSDIGTVSYIDDADLVLNSDGERWLLTVGDRVTDAFALPPEF